MSYRNTWAIAFIVLVAVLIFGGSQQVEAQTKDAQSCAKDSGDVAIAACTRAIRADPSVWQNYSNRGAEWSKKGDYDKTIADFKEAIKLNPKNANAYFRRGNAWYNKGDYDKAIADHNEAIKLNPKYANAYVNRGNARYNKKEYDIAILDYKEALRIDPKVANAAASLQNALAEKTKQGSSVASAPVQQQSPPSMWDHNGSTLYLVAKGQKREFYYQEPRQGMLDAGARAGSLLFSGRSSGGSYSGTAYIYRAGCAPIPYQVSGPILDNNERVVVQGQAPRINSNCHVQGYVADTLEFALIKPNDTVAGAQQPPPLSQNIAAAQSARVINDLVGDWVRVKGESEFSLSIVIDQGTLLIGPGPSEGEGQICALLLRQIRIEQDVKGGAKTVKVKGRGECRVEESPSEKLNINLAYTKGASGSELLKVNVGNQPPELLKRMPSKENLNEKQSDNTKTPGWIPGPIRDGYWSGWLVSKREFVGATPAGTLYKVTLIEEWGRIDRGKPTRSATLPRYVFCSKKTPSVFAFEAQGVSSILIDMDLKPFPVSFDSFRLLKEFNLYRYICHDDTRWNDEFNPSQYSYSVDERLWADIESNIRMPTDILKLSDNPKIAQSASALCESQSGDIAIAACTEAIKQDPQNADAYRNRGIAKAIKGNIDGAIGDYDEAIKLNPEDAAAYQNRSVVGRIKGDSQQAESDQKRYEQIKAAKLVQANRQSPPKAQKQSSPSQRPKFSQYRVASFYTGRVGLPQFDGRDRAYRDYRTRIRDAIKEARGPNFAGDYILVDITLTGGFLRYIVNSRSGHIVWSDDNGLFVFNHDFAFHLQSRLILTHSAGENERCLFEAYEWRNETLTLIHKSEDGERDLDAAWGVGCKNDLEGSYQ